MTRAYLLTPRRRFAALAVAVAGALTLAALTPERNAAAPPKRGPNAVLIALLVPFADRTERGTVQLVQGNFIGTNATGTSRRRFSSIVVDAGGGADEVAYSLRLATRSCAEVQRSPDGFLIDGPLGPVYQSFQGTHFDDVAAVSKRSLRATKSIVLGAHGQDGTFEPRACGTAFSWGVANPV